MAIFLDKQTNNHTDSLSGLFARTIVVLVLVISVFYPGLVLFPPIIVVV